MSDQHRAPRRLLIVDARPDALDGLVLDIAALLARAGCPVRRILSDGPGVSVEPTILIGGAGLPTGLATDGLPTDGNAVGVGDLVVLPDSRTARRGGRDLVLTRIEFDLLAELVRHANRVLTKEALLSRVWPDEPVTANAVEARVSRLRAKLEQLGPRLIHTVRGVGYVLHALPGGDLADPVVIELATDEPERRADPPGRAGIETGRR